MLRSLLALCAVAALAAFASPLAPSALAEKAGLPSAPAASSGCAAGEEPAKVGDEQVCKPAGGACGKGRKVEVRKTGLKVCVDDRNAHAAEISCGEHERPHYPANKKVKPFCEPVGSCGFGRVEVPSAVKGKQQCVPR